MSSRTVFKNYFANYDQILFAVAVLLTIVGVYLQFNIATSLGNSFQMSLFLNQLKSLVVATLVFIAFIRIKKLEEFLFKYSYVFVGLIITMLVFVLLYGITTQGSTRWIRIAFISFQPSQLAHPILIIFYAKYFQKKKDIIKSTGFFKFLGNFQGLIFITLLVVVLIYLERHLSTLIVLCLTLLAMLYVAEFKKRLIFMLIFLTLALLYLGINFSHNYRSGRMDIYAEYSLFHKALGIEKENVSADSYQIRESLKAISQGGLVGTGREGGRAKHLFLPDVNSDYIFAMIGEELGFIGGLIIIILFSIFLFRSVSIGVSAESFFSELVAIGMGINIFVTAMVNIGVSLSALPSTGLTLPFISYGGSALVVNAAMLAIILNISKERLHTSRNQSMRG